MEPALCCEPAPHTQSAWSWEHPLAGGTPSARTVPLRLSQVQSDPLVTSENLRRGSPGPRLCSWTDSLRTFHYSCSAHTCCPFPGPGVPLHPSLGPPPLTVLELVHTLPQRPEVGVVQGCLCGYAALRFILKAQGPVGSWLAGCRDPFGTHLS